MQEYIILLPQEYSPPKSIAQIAPKEWQSILDFIDGAIMSGIARNASDMDNSSIFYALEQKHAAAQSELKNTCESMNEALIRAAANIKMNNSIIENLTEQIKKLNEAAATTYSTQIAPLYEQINDLRYKLTISATEEKERLNKIHIEEISHIEAKYEAQIERRIKEITSIYERQIEESRSISIELKSHITDLADQGEVLKKLDPIVKFYEGSNTEKGNIGESAISAILTESYQEAIIEDVSSQAATGDIFFNWRRLKCLIEVKNKNKIVKDDIDKFLRDVAQCSETSKINCAIFISLRTDKLPGRSRELLQLEYHNGVPIIYTYMPPPSKEIYYAVACLDKILSIEGNNINEEIEQHFINYYNHLIKYQLYFETELKKKQKELKVMSRHLEYHNTMCTQLEPLYSKIANIETTTVCATDKNNNKEDYSDHFYDHSDKDNSRDNKDEQDNKEESLQLDQDPEARLRQLARAYISLCMKNEPPTIDNLCSMLKTSRKNIESAKLKNISSLAKSMHLQSFINQEKIQKIKAFNEEHKRYPSRKDLISGNIFNDHVLRQISKVIKDKNVPKSISEYICTLNQSVFTLLKV